MGKVFRVRFSTKGRSVDQGLHFDAASDPSLAKAHRKSRSGCRKCKRDRVKCDETFPTCKRCERQGIICTLMPKPSHWRLEEPGLLQTSVLPFNCSTAADAKLLQRWFDKLSNFLVLDLRSNPLSLPLIKHIAISPALSFAIQTWTMGYQTGFNRAAEVEFLEKRSRALSLCQSELVSKSTPLTTIFFTVLLLGISAPWMGNADDYGKEHLIGARAILNVLLTQEKSAHNPPAHDPLVSAIIAYYLWWDMSCSFCLDSQELPPLSSLDLSSTTDPGVQPIDSRFGGCMVEIYHILALLLRYCMRVLRGEPRDYLYEERLEGDLLNWHPSRIRDEEVLLAEAFRKHGLIIFYRICRLDPSCGVDNPLRTQIHQYATEVVSMIVPHPITRPYFSLLTIPLLTAGAELTIHDQELRSHVQQAFSSVCDEFRTNTLLRVKILLEELWILRDSGIEISHLELTLQKGWNFTLV